MKVSEVISLLKSLKPYIATTPIDKCSYCSSCPQTKIPTECEECIKAGLRAIDLAIEKVKEKM